MLCDACRTNFHKEKIILSDNKYLCESCLTEKILNEEKGHKYKPLNMFFGKNIKDALETIKGIFKK